MDLSVTPASLVSSVYENLTENIKKLRERKNAPLTLAEKLLFGHATDINSVSLNKGEDYGDFAPDRVCLLYTSPSPRDCDRSRMPSSA